MVLKFLGNGSGFTPHHTNAFYELKDKIILIDISMLNIDKFLNQKPYEKDTYVLLTHMHGDHSSGLGLLIQYYFFKYKNKLNILIPKKQKDDVTNSLAIEGVFSDIYNLLIIDELSSDWKSNNKWFISYIPTTHAPELDGKCFSYVLNFEEKIIVYSGDTNTLTPYVDKEMDEIYLDISALYGGVHLKFDDIKDELIKLTKKTKVYIMHVDDMDEMKKLVKDTPFHIVEMI